MLNCQSAHQIVLNRQLLLCVLCALCGHSFPAFARFRVFSGQNPFQTFGTARRRTRKPDSFGFSVRRQRPP